MAFYQRILKTLASSTKSARFWFSTGIVSGFFGLNLLGSGYRIASVQGKDSIFTGSDHSQEIKNI